MIYLVIWAFINDCSWVGNFAVGCIPSKSPQVYMAYFDNDQKACEEYVKHEGAMIWKVKDSALTAVTCEASYKAKEVPPAKVELFSNEPIYLTPTSTGSVKFCQGDCGK